MKTKNLSVYYQNVRGLRTKTNIFFRNIIQVDYDIVCLTETWLLSGIYDQEIFDSRYRVYRCDRDYETRGDHLGGGVLIALRRELQAYSFSTISMPGAAAEAIELCVDLKSSNKSERLHIFFGYFPHCSRHYDCLLHFFESVSDVIVNNPDDDYLVLGDFNISSAQWTSTDHAVYMTNSTINGDHIVQALQSFVSFTDLRQYNHILNTKNRILDLVFSRKECIVAHCKEPLIDEDPHHPALYVIVKSSPTRVLLSAPRVVRLFHNADYEAINNDIASVEWQILLQGKDVDAAVAEFYDSINKIISKHVPIKAFRCDTRYPPWFSRSLVKIIKEKLKYHKKWKIYGRRSDYDTFSLLRDRQKRVMRECYDKFIIDAENKIKINSKYFWTFVKSKRHSSDLPDTMFCDDKTSSEGYNICLLFNDYFHSVFDAPVSQSSSSLQITPESVTDSISRIVLTIEVVEKYLKSLDVAKSCGPDGLPPLFLKMCCETLASPLTFLFNLSLSDGIMPGVWKQCHVVPVFKSGDRHNIKNYRPITKISTIPKVFEKLIYDIIFPLLRPIIIDQQHGFINKRSTETNLCEFVHQILQKL
ncbi:unnamed protein product [Euphydryas editha]|uniref:Endonuclease/exonuclease/phosphatase domain-containing protein n=1 Tax=Euphydryas editha TaxID=104508 RepID=A0AAU9TCX2_EUPED|nr:unnamed protein product [Euphydryas editha]